MMVNQEMLAVSDVTDIWPAPGRLVLEDEQGDRLDQPPVSAQP